MQSDLLKLLVNYRDSRALHVNVTIRMSISLVVSIITYVAANYGHPH